MLDLGRSIKDTIYSIRYTQWNVNVNRTFNDISIYGDVVTSRFAAAANPSSTTLQPLVSERDYTTTTANALGPIVYLADSCRQVLHLLFA